MGASKPAAPGINTDNYLTIEALEDGMTVSLSVNACEYCIDGSGDWVALPAATATPAVNTGQTLSFKATGLTPTSSAGIGTFSISKKCNLKGNCMSMVYGDEAEGQTTISKSNQFRLLFRECTNVVKVSSDFLPATNMKSNSYLLMFDGCTSLTTAPELPATTLANACYHGMFYNCSSLIAAPALPAMTLATSCYSSMFYGCTSLTTAPELPATELKTACYYWMFCGCERLVYIKAMFLTLPDTTYIENWVAYVPATGTFVKNAAATWDVTGVSGIPEGWTVEVAES